MNRAQVVNLAWMAALCVAAGCKGDASEDGPTGNEGADSKGTTEARDLAVTMDGAFPSELLPAEVVPELKPIVPAEGGRAMFTDVLTVKPGDDVTYCTYVDGVTDRVTYIHDSYGTQSRYGHHVVLYYAPEPEEPGTRKCGDMEKYRQVLGGSGGETADATALPSNVVSEIPAGVQFVLNHHWINYGEEDTDVQAMLITVPPDSEDDLVIARSMVAAGIGWNLPPGEVTTHTVECEFEQDVPTLQMLGHEHEWGTWVKAERVTPDGAVDVLFDHAFQPEYANNPERFYYPLEAPYMFKAGDTLRFTCEWMNDTSDVIEFPREMCVFFANTLAEVDLTCANGNWVGQP